MTTRPVHLGQTEAPTALHMQLAQNLKVERVDQDSWVSEFAGRRFQIVRIDPGVDDAETGDGDAAARPAGIEQGAVRPADRSARTFVAELVVPVGRRVRVDRFEPVGEALSLAEAVKAAVTRICADLRIDPPLDQLPRDADLEENSDGPRVRPTPQQRLR